MAVSIPVIDELEAALQSGSMTRRTEMLRRVTNLFLGTPDNFSKEQVSLFDDVMSRLMTQIEHRVLVELGGRLAPISTAPTGVIQRLARDDDITVSGPVLEHSERLTDEDLVEIAQSKGQQHLLKISSRPRLNEGITDVLIDRGDAHVVNKVAANTGARFSKAGFSKLAICADDDEGLMAIVASRPDIPPLLLRHVLTRATDKVRQRLLTSVRPEARDAIKKILMDVSRQMKGSLTPHQYAGAQRLVHSISQDTALTKSKLREFATAQRMAETVVALSVLSAMPIDLVDHLVNSSSQFGAIVLCKAIGLDWELAHAVMLVRPGSEEEADLESKDLYEEYQQLSTSSAQRLLRFWQARQNHAVATGSIGNGTNSNRLALE